VDVSVLVAQDLKLDVPRALDELLQVECLIAKRGACFCSCRLEHRTKLLLRLDDVHAAAASAARSFEHHGKAKC
jgi:hypothetical protein